MVLTIGSRRTETLGFSRVIESKDSYSMAATIYAIGGFLGHDVAQITECGAGELENAERNWLPRFFLNTMLRVRLGRPTHHIAIGYLRRVEVAFEAYERGRKELQHFVETDMSTISPYFRALSSFESCVSQSYQALELLMMLFNRELFSKGENSDEEQLNLLYNRSKHLNKEIRHGDYPVNHTGPVWLTNDGLAGQDLSFSFDMCRELLKKLAFYAEVFCTVPPDQSRA